MRSGIWRASALANALAAVAILGAIAGDSRAGDIFHHTIPRETPALDYRTGDVMMAPPIPYGEYAKDYAGAVHGAAGMTFGAIHGLVGHVKGLCAKCGGALCGACGGKGLLHGKSCSACGGDGCGQCGSGLGLGGLGHGGGLLHHGAGDPGVAAGGTYQHAGLLHHGHGDGVACVGPGCAAGYAAAQGPPMVPAKGLTPTAAPQSYASAQVDPVCGGCLGLGRNGSGGGCGLCGGTGRLRSLLGGLHGGAAKCGGCGGRGCGLCGGLGAGLGKCGGCGGRGCGLCGGKGLCHGCGGAGCGLCSKLKGKAHSLLGLPAGLAAKALHKGEIKYFVGPGGPVPLTPGYVPYVVTTRSPRDFFAFPPFSDQVP